MDAGKAQVAWAARRALVEGAAVTVERLAAACGMRPRTLASRAAREGWVLAEAVGDGGLTRAQRIARVHDRLLDKVEREQLRTDQQDVPLDKAGIAELAATARILAKIGEITRDEDGAKEKQMERDADIASILDRLDRQVIELARHLARHFTTTLAGNDADTQGIAAGKP